MNNEKKGLSYIIVKVTLAIAIITLGYGILKIYNNTFALFDSLAVVMSIGVVVIVLRLGKIEKEYENSSRILLETAGQMKVLLSLVSNLQKSIDYYDKMLNEYKCIIDSVSKNKTEDS